MRLGRLALILALVAGLAPPPRAQAQAQASAGAPQPSCVQTGCRCPSASPSTAAAAPLVITYFGVSTILFSAGDDQLLVDGFFTRPNGVAMLKPLTPDGDLIEERLKGAGVRRLHAILVAHAHHDHALDTAVIAKATETPVGARRKSDALVVGTRSTLNLMRASQVDATRLCPADRPGGYGFGPFHVTAYKAEHGPAPWTTQKLLAGTTPADLKLPARFDRFDDDDNYSYLIEYGARKILVHPSAGLPEGGNKLPGAELVFVGVGGLGWGFGSKERTRKYWDEILDIPGAQTFVPIHWDLFTRPIDKEPQFNAWPVDNVPQTLGVIEKMGAGKVCFVAFGGSLRLPAQGTMPPVRVEPGSSRRLVDRPACKVIEAPGAP